ncbi:unnamed protein product [Meloidogyne enterolobii]|uniref:Uncharacterized protein n=1 Tax=Meloidogyne enterolobii TaxID=390850 RepID=A0ACB1AA44_MELEN
MRRQLHLDAFSSALLERNENYEGNQFEIVRMIFELNNENTINWINKISKRAGEMKRIKEQLNIDNPELKENFYLNPEGFQPIEIFERSLDQNFIKFLEIKKDEEIIKKGMEILIKIINKWKSKNGFKDDFKITGIYEFGIWLIEDVEINIVFDDHLVEKYFGSERSICEPLISKNCKDNSLYCFLCREGFVGFEVRNVFNVYIVLFEINFCSRSRVFRVSISNNHGIHPTLLFKVQVPNLGIFTISGTIPNPGKFGKKRT